MPLELWKMWWSVQQVKYHHDLWCWSLVWYWHYWVVEDCGSLTLNAKWCAYGKKVECWTALQLSQWVCNADVKPVLITKVLRILQVIFFVTCFMHPLMCLFYLSFAPMSHGNSCPRGQLPGSEQCLVIFVVDKNHCKAHTSMSVLVCTNLSRDSIWIAYMCVLQWGPSWEVSTYWLLMVVVIMIRLGSYAFVC